MNFFRPDIRSLRKYIVIVLYSGKYAFTSSVKKVKHSRLDLYFDENSAADIYITKF